LSQPGLFTAGALGQPCYLELTIKEVRQMKDATYKAVEVTELSDEIAVELPDRQLLATVSLLGLPLVGVSDVGVFVDTSGPGWLVGSLGSL
jgi:hypothetical protein